MQLKQLPQNPGSVNYLESSEPENYPDIDLAQILADQLEGEGNDVRIVKDEDGNRWIHVSENDYYLLPLLNWGDNNDENQCRAATTIQIQHPTLFPDGIYEYQYSLWYDDFAEAIAGAFASWLALDWQTLKDAADPEGGQGLQQSIDIAHGDQPIRHRIHFGGVQVFPNLDEDDPAHDEFCPCCLFTRSIEAFSDLLHERGKNHAIRLFASKDSDSSTSADCRIDGDEYPAAQAALQTYAASWKNCDSIKFRKQYIIIIDASDAPPGDIPSITLDAHSCHYH